MPRGGARVNSGPPPDPNALRRNRPSDQDTWTDLPAESSVPVPPWPLAPLYEPEDDASFSGDLVAMVTDLEKRLWVTLWKKPQASMWALLGCVDDVAIYARLRAVAETTLNTKLLAEARMRGDRLGVDPAAMHRMRWRVKGDEIKAAREKRTTARRVSKATHERAMRVVNGGGAT